MANLKPLHALNLDPGQQQNFVNYFKSLDKKPATTIRFFNRIDYFTLHGEDAVFAAEEVFKSTANIKTMGLAPYDLKYIVLSKGNFENFVRELLLVKQYRVEVYSTQGSSKNNDWFVQHKGSPGNLTQFEDILFNGVVTETCIIMAVQIIAEGQSKSVAVAFADTDMCSFSVHEFPDNEAFTHLEALLVQISPKECLLPKISTLEGTKLKSVLERCNVLVTQLKKTDFDPKDIVQDLTSLINFEDAQKQSANMLKEIEYKYAMGALSAIIKYRGLISDKSFEKQFKFIRLNRSRFVHMDSAAMSALHILPKNDFRTGKLQKHHSILGLLDRCRTSQGHRLLASWVKQPLRDINEINERHDIVEHFVDDAEIRHSLHNEFLKQMPDFQLLSRKLLRKKANLQDCYRLYQAVQRIPYLIVLLNKHDNPVVKNVFVEPLIDCLQSMEKYQQMIQQNVDLSQIDHGEYFLKPSLDAEFQNLYDQMRFFEKKIQSCLTRSAKDLGLESGKTIKLDNNPQLGHFFRISLKDERILRKNSNYKVLDAIKGGVRFTNDDLEDLNEKYLAACKSYQERQSVIVNEIIDIGAGYAEPLGLLSLIIAKVDVLVSFAVTACEAPQTYVRPKMHNDEIQQLKMTGIRHPCLELQEDVNYIPNDVEFNQDTTTTVIITGPNMGGKSTYIRSVAVAVHMAHIGSFVACERADISIVDSILGRVGAEDSVTKGLSTFMTEMLDTAGILKAATNKSLVIIDELGRGTSTYEGCGIAWAIAEYLCNNVKAFTLFATHFHEITRLAEEYANVSNMHVSALCTDDNFTLLHSIKPGVCNKSFGIQVSRMVNFPKEVVKYAERKHAQLEHNATNADVESIEECDGVIEKFLQACTGKNINESEEIFKKDVQSMLHNMVDVNNDFLKAILNKLGDNY